MLYDDSDEDPICGGLVLRSEKKFDEQYWRDQEAEATERAEMRAELKKIRKRSDECAEVEKDEK